MASNIDVDELLEDANRFLPVPTVAFEGSRVTLVESCLRWQSEGMPFAIKGVRLDGDESPFLGTDDWLARLPRSFGKHHRCLCNAECGHEPIIRREVGRWGPI